MKRILFILLFIPLFSKAQLTSFIVRGDTLFCVDPNTGQERQLTNLVPAATNQSGKLLSSNGTSYSLIAPTIGYTLSVQALTSSPTDGQTIFFGNLPRAPTTTGATSKIFIRQAGTIKRAEIYCFSGTAGTNEAWVLSIRKNNTTDTQIASVAISNSERVFSNTALNISVVSGDYIEIKCVNPTWATNPLTTIFGGYVYVE